VKERALSAASRVRADSLDRTIVHLNHRDVTMICASRAPLARLEAYKRRMGWSFQWVSSLRAFTFFVWSSAVRCWRLRARPSACGWRNRTARPSVQTSCSVSAGARSSSVAGRSTSFEAAAMTSFTEGRSSNASTNSSHCVDT
jgi:hypothetical protein